MLGMGRLVNCRLLPSYVAWLCNQGLANSNKYLISPRPETMSVTKPHASHTRPDFMEPFGAKLKSFHHCEKQCYVAPCVSCHSVMFVD